MYKAALAALATIILAFGGLFGGGKAHVYKFGANPAIGTDYEDIWDGSATYSWIVTSTGTTLQVSSADANDDAGDAGCTNVTVEGLAPTTYAEIKESFIMNGQTAVTGTTSFYRVHRAYCTAAGASGSNEGALYVSDATTALSSGVPAVAGNIRAQISATNGQTLMAIYTIPAGYNGQVHRIHIGSDDDTKAVTFQIMERKVGEAWRVKWQGTTNGTPYDEEVNVPSFRFQPKSDVRVRAKGSAGGAAGEASFQLSLK